MNTESEVTTKMFLAADYSFWNYKRTIITFFIGFLLMLLAYDYILKVEIAGLAKVCTFIFMVTLTFAVVIHWIGWMANEDKKEKLILQAIGRTESFVDLFEGLLSVEIEGWPVIVALEHAKVGFTLNEYQSRMVVVERDKAKELSNILPGKSHNELVTFLQEIWSTESWNDMADKSQAFRPEM